MMGVLTGSGLMWCPHCKGLYEWTDDGAVPFDSRLEPE